MEGWERGWGQRVKLENSEAKALARQPACSPPDECLVSAVCQILPKGVVAVLGPSSSPASSSIISNICGEKEVSSRLGAICRLEACAQEHLGVPRAGSAQRGLAAVTNNTNINTSQR